MLFTPAVAPAILLLYIAIAILATAYADVDADISTNSMSSSSPRKEEEKQQQPQQRSSPLQVFILCGQSNMQGHGYMDTTDEHGNFRNGTLEWMVETYPEKYNKLKEEEDDDEIKSNTHTRTRTRTRPTSHWKQRDDIYIVYNRQNVKTVRPELNQHGYLVAGYGGDPGQEDHQMGPELGFGYALGDAFQKEKENDNNNNKDNNTDNSILFIKIAWGGKSLAADFRPPSSNNGTTGLYYEAVMATIYQTLADLPQIFPNYQALYGDSGYQLSGWGWHQGWNDGCDDTMTQEYEYNLANLIRDIRIDLKTPHLPVSIGVSGMNGWKQQQQQQQQPHDDDDDHDDTTDDSSSIKSEENREAIIAAQFAVANATKYPEFAGTVQSVETRSYYRESKASPGEQIYHWNNNCESYWLIGQAMGKAMVELVMHTTNHTTATTTSNNKRTKKKNPVRENLSQQQQQQQSRNELYSEVML